MNDPLIKDDGTMDTLVEYRGMFRRYNSEYRFQFKNDDEFLAEIKIELDDEIHLRECYKNFNE
tara:strand:- start:1385 stop:1573 length:189 start_codon:yes stop_codon:yes gene_type:complete